MPACSSASTKTTLPGALAAAGAAAGAAGGSGSSGLEEQPWTASPAQRTRKAPYAALSR